MRLPTKFLDIDFETRSEADITKTGAAKYAMHASTSILMISFSFDQETVYNWNPYFPNRKNLRILKRYIRKVVNKEYVLRAHHSEFEYWIWNKVATKQFGWPELPVSAFYDTMVLTCAMGYPASLENAGIALGLEEQKQAKEGKRLINFFSKPSRKKEEKWKEPIEYKTDFFEFVEYCNQDVRTQIAIANSCKPMDKRQYEVFLLTETMNVRGLPIDKAQAEGAIHLVDEYKQQAAIHISELTNKEIESPTQNKLKDWINAQGCDIPNLQAATIEKYLADDRVNGDIRTALELRSNASKSSTAKYVTALDQLTEEGRVHGFIKAFIAHTGRWGGRGIQIQNFPKPAKEFPSWCDYEVLTKAIADKDATFIEMLYENIMGSLKAAARAMIAAPKGQKFVSADYSQIEARIVMWLADDNTGLNDFAGDGRIYENMAATIFNVDPNNILKPSFERDVGKETVLGCGFGMGWQKFLGTCVDARNLPLDQETAVRAVKEYRKRYGEVPKAWRKCEASAIRAIQNPYDGVQTCNGRLTYFYDNKHLFVTLPSGRQLCYPDVKITLELNDWGKEQLVIRYKKWNMQAKVGQKWQYEKTWGGTLFQHSVQAIAADIMADGMLEAEKNGYPILFTVHDESVSLVKKDFGSFEEYERLLCTLQPWAQGIPIVAEGWEGPRYRK